MSVRAPVSRGRRVLPGFMVGIALLFLAPLAWSNQASGVDPDTTPLIVSGTVYDEAGNPLDGADVVVTDLITAASDSFVTIAGGFYVGVINVGSWDIGDTIQVAVTAPGGAQTSRTGPANESGDIVLNVHFPTAIPQLGGPVGLAIAAGLVGVVAVVAVGVRRR